MILILIMYVVSRFLCLSSVSLKLALYINELG